MAADWHRQRASDQYAPAAFDDEGFVHCTLGLDRLLVPANIYYRDDRRRFVVLQIDLDRIHAPVRYDDPDRIYPHVYGPIDVAAVVATRSVVRADDGTFLGFSG